MLRAVPGTAQHVGWRQGSYWGTLVGMADLDDLDRAYSSIMNQVATTATAPHHTELAGDLGVSLGESRDLIHELVAMTPGWPVPAN